MIDFNSCTFNEILFGHGIPRESGVCFSIYKEYQTGVKMLIYGGIKQGVKITGNIVCQDNKYNVSDVKVIISEEYKIMDGQLLTYGNKV